VISQIATDPPTVDLVIEFNRLARESLNTFSTSEEHLRQLLDEAFQHQPYFLQFNYEGIPIDLSDGFHAIVTKLRNRISIDNVTKSILHEDINRLWSEFGDSYVAVYRLPYRTNHLVLFRTASFQRTYQILDRSIRLASEYVTISYPNAGVHRLPHKLLAHARDNLAKAESQYHRYQDANNNEELLGEVAITLELVVASLHQIVTEYLPTR
jgi:hypothetical protein